MPQHKESRANLYSLIVEICLDDSGSIVIIILCKSAYHELTHCIRHSVSTYVWLLEIDTTETTEAVSGLISSSDKNVVSRNTVGGFRWRRHIKEAHPKSYRLYGACGYKPKVS